MAQGKASLRVSQPLPVGSALSCSPLPTSSAAHGPARLLLNVQGSAPDKGCRGQRSLNSRRRVRHGTAEREATTKAAITEKNVARSGRIGRHWAWRVWTIGFGARRPARVMDIDTKALAKHAGRRSCELTRAMAAGGGHVC
jgi:hypothetical protein